ncbi:MAG: dTMP kinase [Patescibacteria group bacterium]
MFKNKYPGKFIAIEGTDGSGKSTQVFKLKEYFKIQHIPCYLTQEPTSSIIGGIIRGRLTGDWQTVSPTSLQLLFAADRANHLEYEIVPQLEKGVNVITDRYFLSSLAYGSIDIKDESWLMRVNDLFLIPDLTVILKTSIKTAIKRMRESDLKLELFDDEKTIEKVWQTYEMISKKYPNIKVIDGDQEEDAVFKEIRETLENLLLK